MNREILIQIIIDKIQQLPDIKIQEINDFAEFLIRKKNDSFQLEGIQKLTSDSTSFDYLKNVEELFSLNDLKEDYKFETKFDDRVNKTIVSKDVLIDELKNTPDEFVNEILVFIKMLKNQKIPEKIYTHLASENVLSKDWLKLEEEEAWKDL